jgi:long-chain-alcohol oxidase
MLEHNHKFTMISLTRDRDGGSIVIDAQGRPRINYDISPFDAASCLKGVLAACEVMLAAGAKRISNGKVSRPGMLIEDGDRTANLCIWLS